MVAEASVAPSTSEAITVSTVEEENTASSNRQATLTSSDVESAANSSNVVKSSAKNLQRINVTKTLLIVYITYVICWTPNQVGFLQFNLGGPYDFKGAYHSFSVILAVCNTAVNPFIYALQYKQYRTCLKSLFKCK